jgi:hypothetical protein
MKILARQLKYSNFKIRFLAKKNAYFWTAQNFLAVLIVVVSLK